MELRKRITSRALILLCLLLFGFYPSAQNKDSISYEQLLEVNKYWKGKQNSIEHSYIALTEQERVKLHLQNVVSYLKKQATAHLSAQQIAQRKKHIETLESYTKRGRFPLNHLSNERLPIFIDDQNTHCAVGYLMKESGHEKMAREIADQQLLSYLHDIKHPDLLSWQKASGLSLDELALIQPTYGPPIPVCAAPSPIEWKKIKSTDGEIVSLFSGNFPSSIIAVINTERGSQQQLASYSTRTQDWVKIGDPLDGKILDLKILWGEIYLSVLMYHEEMPHQLLKLRENKWQKLAHFNGSVNAMSVFQNRLYVSGHFSKVNDSISCYLACVDEDEIKAFAAHGYRQQKYEKMCASDDALFFVASGAIYRYKSDTVQYMNAIQYHQYLNSYEIAAEGDTLYVLSSGLGGYQKNYNKQSHTVYVRGQIYPDININYNYGQVSFSHCTIYKGRGVLSGAFRASTMDPQINDERVLVECPVEESAHWFGHALLYEMDNKYYPLMSEGSVSDFELLNDEIFALKDDGKVYRASINSINKKIDNLIQFSAAKDKE
jgi:hypothetical protein